jgi:hypothetical protein
VVRVAVLAVVPFVLLLDLEWAVLLSMHRRGGEDMSTQKRRCCRHSEEGVPPTHVRDSTAATTASWVD